MNIKFTPLFVIVPLLMSQLCAAQDNGFGIHFGGYDFYGPQTHKYVFTDQRTTAGGTSTHKVLMWKPEASLSYWHKINPLIDLGLKASASQKLSYPGSGNDTIYTANRYNNTDTGANTKHYLFELDARAVFNILPKEHYLISPYIVVGINGSYHNRYVGADVPVGVGVNINLSSAHTVYLNLESRYKIASTDHDQNHLQHEIGLVFWPRHRMPPPPPAPAPPPPPPVVKDSDHDGVPDSLDACPFIAGLPQFQGCPDTDGDGIPDNKDKCPDVAGLPEYAGCPPPDRDHDGVIDSEDQCPDVPGIAANHGCPEIKKEVITRVEKAAKAIFFNTGKSTLKKISYAQLNVVVGIMKEDTTLYADIEGYTDNVGKPERNVILSDARAAAVRNYFVSKGISADRLTSKGYGETNPVADNKSAPGRAQNRRTVIKLRNYKQ